MTPFTLVDLKRIMRQCAGEDESLPLEGDILNTPFGELGYDSLALLETSSRIDRQYEIKLPDDIVNQAPTPGSYVQAVNACLTRTAGQSPVSSGH